MSKAANIGELRTAVYFHRIDKDADNEGFMQENEVNVFGEGKPVFVKWINTHGSEVFTAMQLGLKQPVTVTMRYSPLINERLIAYKVSEYSEALKLESPEKRRQAMEQIAYEVISVDNVGERNAWLELKLQRKVAAR